MSRSTIRHDGMTAEYDSVSKSNRSKTSEFLRYLKGMGRCKNTTVQYRSWLNIFFAWNVRENNNKPFAKERKGDFMRYFSWLASLNVGTSRIHGLRSALSSMSDWFENAYGDEFPRFRNCVKSIPMPKQTVFRKPTILGESDVAEMVKKCNDAKEPQLAVYIALLASCGCRKAEALQFKMSFFSDNNLQFNNVVWKTPEIRLKGGKMKSKYVFRKEFVDELNIYIQSRKENGIRTDSFFTKSNGKPETLATLSSFASRISKICGIDFYAHCLRHYFATYLIRKGVPSQTIVKIVGWESAGMLAIYDDRTDDEAIGEGIKDISL